jgi:hypothetical protein
VVRAHVLRAEIAAARGDVAAAADAFAAALSLDHGAALPDGAPAAAQQAHSLAELRVGAGPVLAVVHAPPASVRLGSPVELRFALAGDPLHLVRGVLVHYRAGQGAFSTLPLAAIAQDTAVVLPRVFSASLLPGSRVEYYGEVVDADGAVLEHLGTQAAPFRLETRAAPVSIARRWWFWTAGAGTVAVVAGLAVGLTLGLNHPPPSTPVSINTGLGVR